MKTLRPRDTYDPPPPENVTHLYFPPSLNVSFRNDFIVNNYHRNMSIMGPGNNNDTMLFEALHNLTLAERLATDFQGNPFGSDTAVVRVGDVIDLSWQGTENRTVTLNCLTCSLGAPDGGLIENACDNYTDSAHMNDIFNQTLDVLPGTAYVVPSLESYFNLPNETCAMCMFDFSAWYPNIADDYSVPFPVLKQPSNPPKRFSAKWPSGISDFSLGNSRHSKKSNVGVTVGAVIGVVAAVAIILAILWIWWKEKKAGAKTLESEARSTIGRGGAGAPVGQEERDIALQRMSVPGVVRRPSSSASEVPPPYHEAIKDVESGRRYG